MPPRKTKFGPGRPPETIPEGWEGAILAMAREGRSVDYIRDVLKKDGKNVSKIGISKCIASKDETLVSVANGVVKNAGLFRGLDSVEFEEYREVVDDFILDGRSPVRIKAYLYAEGFEAPIDALVEYCNRRKAELESIATDAKTTEEARHKLHTKTLRRRLAEIWHHMPRDERYSSRMFGLVLSEYGLATRYNIEQLKTELENGKDPQAANEELERKLGLVEDAPVDETSNSGIDTGSEPSGAEAAMGATT